MVTTTETYEPGRRFGPYELLEPLGHGGMGYVWKARDTRLDRVVAVKFSHQRFTERFMREAKAIGALNHPHICTLYDIGPDYLVMEFIDGQPLSGPLPLKNALEYGIQVVAALAEAHRKGIVHRDLKPANIMVAEEGVKVLDFGLAKQVEPQVGRDIDSMKSAQTAAGMVLGTVAYMSPEQAQGLEVDRRSDIFSFGAVLYEVLTGKKAFPTAPPPLIRSRRFSMNSRRLRVRS